MVGTSVSQHFWLCAKRLQVQSSGDAPQLDSAAAVQPLQTPPKAGPPLLLSEGTGRASAEQLRSAAEVRPSAPQPSFAAAVRPSLTLLTAKKPQLDGWEQPSDDERRSAAEVPPSALPPSRAGDAQLRSTIAPFAADEKPAQEDFEAMTSKSSLSGGLTDPSIYRNARSASGESAAVAAANAAMANVFAAAAVVQVAAQAIVRQQQEMSTQLPYQQQDWQQLWELQQPSHWSRQQQTWPPEAWQPGAWQPEAWQPVARSTYQCNYVGLAQNAWEGTRPYDQTWTSRRFASEPYRCERQSVFLANSSEKFLRLVRSIIFATRSLSSC